MAGQIKKLTLQMIAGANVVTAVLMLLVGVSDRLNPVDHPVLAVAGLVFPAFIFVNVCFLFFFAVFKRKYMLVSFIGFVVSYYPIRTYCPLNLKADAPPGAIKVLSYNVNSFNRTGAPEDDPNPIQSYILNSGADIVCLQEGVPYNADMDKVKAVYEYTDTAVNLESGDVLMLLSKYPILAKEHIRYESENNISAAFTLKIGKDTVVVVNNHLERTGLSIEERAGFKKMLKGKSETDVVRKESRQLLSKLSMSAQVRAPQADSVAAYVRNCRHSVIVCGDFNDSPISYTRRTIADGLTDCYVATGNGPGISYHGNAMFVRIDNIMCSEDWTPYGCKVDRSIGYSDHYPIYCRLEKAGKDKKQ